MATQTSPSTLSLEQKVEDVAESEGALNETRIPVDLQATDNYDMFDHDHEIDENNYEDATEDIHGNHVTTTDVPMVTPKPPEAEVRQRIYDSSEQLKKIVLGVSDDLKIISKNQAVAELNQEILHVGLLECRNEIDRAKIYARNRTREITCDIMDMNYELSNLVLYDLEKSEWDHFLKHYGGDPKVAIKGFAMSFIWDYWRSYEEIDVKATKLKQTDGNGKESDKWRCLIRMGSPSDATKLKNRCLANGYFKIRSGMTKQMRSYCLEVQQYVDNENAKRSPDSETILQRKFQHKIAEVKRIDGSFVKYLDFHAPSEPFMASKMQESISLVKEITEEGVTLKENSRTVQKRAPAKPTQPTPRPPPRMSPSPSTSHTRNEMVNGSHKLGGHILKTSAGPKNTGHKRKTFGGNPGGPPPPPPKKQYHHPKKNHSGSKNSKNFSSVKRGKDSSAPSERKVDTPVKLSRSEINKTKVAVLKPLLGQSQQKVEELKQTNAALAASKDDLEAQLVDMRKQLDFQSAELAKYQN